MGRASGPAHADSQATGGQPLPPLRGLGCSSPYIRYVGRHTCRIDTEGKRQTAERTEEIRDRRAFVERDDLIDTIERAQQCDQWRKDLQDHPSSEPGNARDKTRELNGVAKALL